MVDEFAVGVGDGANNFVTIRRPIRGFSEIQLAPNALVVGNDEVTVLVNPTLAAKQIVNAGGHLVPPIMILVSRKSNIYRSYH